MNKGAVALGSRVLAAAATIEREVRTRLREEFDTTVPRFDLLAALDAAAREGEVGSTPSALSRRMGVTNGNLTGLVERLADDRLITRTASPDDGRAQVITLTKLGKRTYDAIAKRHRVWLEEIFADIGPRDRAQLERLLTTLTEA